MNTHKQVSIKRTTAKRLDDLKLVKMETYDNVIIRLIEKCDQNDR